MDREPLLFVVDDGQSLATARLLFTPTKITRMANSRGDLIYEEGRDYLWHRGTNLLTLTQGARIPFKTQAQMHPAPGEPDSIWAAKDGKSHLLWAERSLYHDLQVVATYEHAEVWTLPMSKPRGEGLAAFKARLKAGKVPKIVVLGDSISVGYNASGMMKVEPFQPAYPELLVSGLESRLGLKAGSIPMVNLSVAGQSAAWGVTMVPQVVAENPDLVIVAFGMNDSGGTEPTVFANNIRQIIEGVRAKCREAQLILVSSMVGNPEWAHIKPERFIQNRDELASLQGTGVVLADVTTAWVGLTEVKKFTDLTGNGVNHPNDFGHRLYAQIVLGVLMG